MLGVEAKRLASFDMIEAKILEPILMLSMLACRVVLEPLPHRLFCLRAESTEPLFKVGAFPKQLIVAHYFNHQTHHRGQVTTLLTQAGRNVGQTDLWGLPGAGL
jgi:hypothetical protein